MSLSRLRHPAPRHEPPRTTRPPLEPLPWTQPRVQPPEQPDTQPARGRRSAAVRVAAVTGVVVLLMLIALLIAGVVRAEVAGGRNSELSHSIHLRVLEDRPIGSAVRVGVVRGSTRMAWHDARFAERRPSTRRVLRIR